MNKKAEQEYKQLIKLGVTESLARLIVMKKYHSDSEECNFLLDDEIQEQQELANAIHEFKFQQIVPEPDVLLKKLTPGEKK